MKDIIIILIIGSWCSDESKISIARNTTVEQDGRPRGHFYTLELFEKHIEYHERPTRYT